MVVKEKKPGRRIGKIETDAGSQEVTVNEKVKPMSDTEIEELKKENEVFEELKRKTAEEDKIKLVEASKEIDKLFEQYEEEDNYPGKEGLEKESEIPEEELLEK